ncbi:MBL fold metallo-hydrolase [Pantoea endophytica]|uniref:MBL fold metallo-hydrolase n=1 Tax=Pantoea endophytica TaxID=92488 RepID=UPI00301634E4
MSLMHKRIFHHDGVRFFKITSPSIQLPLNQLYPGTINQDTLPDTPFEIPVNSWMVEYRDQLILIDAGISRLGEEQLPVSHNAAPSFFEQLALFGKKAEDISMVILTHLHLDHVGWSTVFENGVWKPAFAGATYYMSRNEVDYLLSDKGIAEGGGDIFKRNVLPLILDNQVRVVSDPRSEIAGGIMYQEYPGHSPGHMIVRFRTQHSEICFCGDIFHSTLQIGNPSLSSSFCRNTVQALTSRKTFLKRAAARGSLVCSAHLDSPSAGFISFSGGGYSWQPLQPDGKTQN